MFYCFAKYVKIRDFFPFTLQTSGEIQGTENKQDEREKIIHESKTYGALDVECEAEPPKTEVKS